jgi:outer membrane immunogenic protein
MGQVLGALSDQVLLEVGGRGLDDADLEGSHTFTDGAVTGNLRLKSDVQGSARLRAGYAIGNVLLYTTGGLAVANAKLSTDNIGSRIMHLGWTVGVGAEYAVTMHWIVRAEVRYSNFQNKTYQTVLGPVKSGWNQTAATLGVSHKF